MKVKCIMKGYGLTLDKVYEVENENYCYEVINDFGTLAIYNKNRFNVIEK